MANELEFEITSSVRGAIDALDKLNSALGKVSKEYSATIKSVGASNIGSQVYKQAQDSLSAMNNSLQKQNTEQARLSSNVTKASAAFENQAAKINIAKAKLEQLYNTRKNLEGQVEESQIAFSESTSDKQIESAANRLQRLESALDRNKISITSQQLAVEQAQQRFSSYGVALERSKRELNDFNDSAAKNAQATLSQSDALQGAIDKMSAKIPSGAFQESYGAQAAQAAQQAVSAVNSLQGATSSLQAKMEAAKISVSVATAAYNDHKAAADALSSRLATLSGIQSQLAASGSKDAGTFGVYTARLRQELETANSALANSAFGLAKAKQGLLGVQEASDKAAQAQQALAEKESGASNETSALANETERAGSSARRGAAGWEKMLVSIKNIVFYRLVRGAIKALMNEVITGFQNLVQWSAKFQGTSGGTFSNFNKNVSLILSDMVMLKNAFAAAAEPIIGLLTPAIDWLITTLASAMNYLSAFLSMLTGRSTYTKAVKNVGNYAQSLNGASKAQKNFLAGFDELTTIPSQSSGASAGKNMGIDPSKMFVTEKIPEVMKSLGDGALMQNLTQFITDSLNKASDFIAKIDWQGLGKKLYDSIYKEIASVNWTALLESIFKFLGSAVGAVSGLAWGFIKDLFVKTIIPALQDSGNYFSDKIEECGGNIVEGILKGVTDGMVNIFNWICEHIFIPFIDGFKSAFGIHSPSTVMAEMGGYIISGLLKGITDTIGKIVATIEIIKLTIKTKFWEMVVDAQSWGSQFISNIKNGISGGVYSVVNAVGNMNSQIWNKIQELISSAWSWGADFMQGFKSGIDSFINGVIDSVSGLASKIKRLLHFSSPDEGPLADYETWMPDFMKGLAQGINSNAYRVTDSIKALTDNMSGTFNVPVTGIVSGVSANVTGAATTSALQSQADSNAGMADVVWQAAMAVVEAVAQNKTTIQIGDDVIGKSAQRYNARAAMVNG